MNGDGKKANTNLYNAYFSRWEQSPRSNVWNFRFVRKLNSANCIVESILNENTWDETKNLCVDCVLSLYPYFSLAHTHTHTHSLYLLFHSVCCLGFNVIITGNRGEKKKTPKLFIHPTESKQRNMNVSVCACACVQLKGQK